MLKSWLEFEVDYDPVSLHALCDIPYGQVCVFRALVKEDGEELTVRADFKGRIRSINQEQNAYNYSVRTILKIEPTSKMEITQERIDLVELTFKKLDSPLLRPVYGSIFDDYIGGGTEKMKKELAEAKKNAIPHAKKILKNGDYMTVLWADGTKTIVKRAADEPQSDYAAFTAALGIKAYGSNSALKRIVAGAEEQGKRKKKKPATNAGKQQNEGEILRALEEIKEGNRAAYKHDNRS